MTTLSLSITCIQMAEQNFDWTQMLCPIFPMGWHSRTNMWLPETRKQPIKKFWKHLLFKFKIVYATLLSNPEKHRTRNSIFEIYLPNSM